MENKKLVHDVFFTLKDKSDDAVDALIDDCYLYLKDIEGILYFSAGNRVPEHDREVNVSDYEVGLQIVFTNKSYHDNYQNSEKHNTFVERNKENWEKVRVFDTYSK